MLKPGAEICAPVCVATALLCTIQPAVPRLDTSLAPVLDDELAAGVNGAACAAGASGAACAPEASPISADAEMATMAQRAETCPMR